MSRPMLRYTAMKLASLCLFALTAFLTGCGTNNNSSNSPTLTGNWTFTARSIPTGATFIGTGSLTQSGKTISGQMSLSGSPCATSGAISGIVANSTVMLELQEGSQQVALTGSANSPDSSISLGNYTTPIGGCLHGDHGTWTATKD